jgi:hypothetical protein
LRLALFVAAAAAAIVIAAPAGATGPRITKHDRDVIRFFQHHPGLAHTAAGGEALASVLPHVVAAIRSLQAADVAIPHLALWRCIAGYPGARPDGGPGETGGAAYDVDSSHSYFNILQMEWDWYGIGNPNAYTPRQIMRLAETQFRLHGYSTSWLEQNWPNTSPDCLGFA